MNLFAEWARVKPFLLPAIACTNGTHTVDDVLLMLGAGQLTLWPGAKAALITEIEQKPRMKVLNVFLGGGDVRELIQIENRLVDFARAQGCTRITGGSRRSVSEGGKYDGWQRVLPGYVFGGNFYYKDIVSWAVQAEA